MSAIGSRAVAGRRLAMPAATVLAACSAVMMLAAGPARAAEEPATPPLRIEVSGQYEKTWMGSKGGDPFHGSAQSSWAEHGESKYSALGAIEPDPLTFTTDTGVEEGENACQAFSVKRGITRWGMPLVNESSSWEIGLGDRYPEAGWKYLVKYRGWGALPGTETLFEEFCTGGTYEAELGEPNTLEWRRPMGNMPENPEKEAFEAAFDAIEVEPNGTANVSRSISWSGKSTACGTECESKYTEKLALTVAVTSGSGSKGESTAPKGTGEESKGKGEAPQGSSSPGSTPESPEEAKQKEKREAEGRIPQETDWGALANGAAKAGGAVGALATALAKSADSTLAKDEQTVNDPPLWSVRQLAEPRAVKASGPSCTGAYEPSSRSCAKLQRAEKALLSASADVAAVTEAQYTTIARQSGAIDAGDRSAAEAQASHFVALGGELDRALSAQAAAGGKVAALLRKAHVSGHLSKAQMAKGVKALDAALRKQGLTSVEIVALDLSRAAKASDFLTALAHGAG